MSDESLENAENIESDKQNNTDDAEKIMTDSPSSEESAENGAESAPSEAAETSETAEFDENSAEVEREEERLDALDATPENRRRSAIILVIIVILSAIGIAVLVLHPPLSWQPEKKKASNFHPVAEIAAVTAGTGDTVDFSYKTVVSDADSESGAGRDHVYRLSIVQTSQFSDKADVRTTLDTDIILSRPALRQADDEITIKLADVETHVFDGDTEVRLAGSGSILEGIALYSRLEKHNGMSSVVPDANINPQVARVLFVVADTLRYIWPPVPEKPVALGSSWTFKDLNDKEVPLIREGRTVISREENRFRLDTEYVLSGTNEKKLGTGKVTAYFTDGEPVEAQGDLMRNAAVGEGPAGQKVHFRITPADEK